MKLIYSIFLGVSLFTVYTLFDIGHMVKQHIKSCEELNSILPMRDYQIEIDNDSIYIFDGNRFVGSTPWSSGLVDSLILKDNY